MDIRHEQNQKEGDFFIEIDGERLGELKYSVSKPGEIAIYHTGVDEKLRGHKAGEKLVAAAVEFARANELKIVPTCPYAKKVIDQTPEYQDVLA
jgi:predicted GNAT family acetyltransferase